MNLIFLSINYCQHLKLNEMAGYNFIKKYLI